MKNKAKLSFLALFFFIFISAPVYANSVFIEKFKIHSPDKGDEFLAPGIDSVLRTELSSIKGVTLISEKEKAESSISGSVMIIGESVITTASMKRGDIQVIAINKKGDSKSSVLDHITYFAAACKKELKKEVKDKPIVKEVKNEKKPLEKQVSKKGIIYSSPLINENIISIASQDFNHDKIPEIIWITEKKLYISNIIEGNLKNIKEVKLSPGISPLSIEIGSASTGFENELIINAYNHQRNRFEAMGYSVNKDLNLTQSDLPENYMYRTIYGPSGEKYLTAKKGGAFGELFSGKIKVLDHNGKYSFKEFNLNKKFEFFPGISTGLYTQDKNQEWAVLKNGNLIIYDSKPQDIWKASDKFGGSNIKIKIPPETKDDTYDPYFIPKRLITVKGQNGTNILLSIKNIDTGKRLLKRLRLFKEGYIKGLSWNQISMDEIFSTRKFQGWIGDFGLTDLDNNGKSELILINSQKFGTFSAKIKSRIIVTKFE